MRVGATLRVGACNRAQVLAKKKPRDTSKFWARDVMIYEKIRTFRLAFTNRKTCKKKQKKKIEHQECNDDNYTKNAARVRAYSV